MFNVGDSAVYPAHGVGVIKKIEEKTVGGKKKKFYVLEVVENQMTIMEDFVLDVAKNTRADPQTTRQFREIINFYRKQASMQVKNPQLKALFEKVDANFKKLDRYGNVEKDKRGEKFEEAE